MALENEGLDSSTEIATMKTQQAEAYLQKLQISVSTLVLFKLYFISKFEGIFNQQGSLSSLNNKERRKQERL
jgi:hypothetical protein